MVTIRLRREGAKKQPYYRVVVTDSHSPREGKFIEIIGNYNPRMEPPAVEIDGERALYWLGVGAQPSEAVKHMLDKLGLTARAETGKPAASRPEVPLPVPEPIEEEEELPEEEFEEADEAEELEELDEADEFADVDLEDEIDEDDFDEDDE